MSPHRRHTFQFMMPVKNVFFALLLTVLTAGRLIGHRPSTYSHDDYEYTMKLGAPGRVWITNPRYRPRITQDAFLNRQMKTSLQTTTVIVPTTLREADDPTTQVQSLKKRKTKSTTTKKPRSTNNSCKCSPKPTTPNPLHFLVVIEELLKQINTFSQFDYVTDLLDEKRRSLIDQQKGSATTTETTRPYTHDNGTDTLKKAWMNRKKGPKQGPKEDTPTVYYSYGWTYYQESYVYGMPQQLPEWANQMWPREAYTDPVMESLPTPLKSIFEE